MKNFQLLCVFLGLVLSGVVNAQNLRAGVVEVANRLNQDVLRSESSKVSMLSLYLLENYDPRSLKRLKEQFHLPPSHDAEQWVKLNRMKRRCTQHLKSSADGYSSVDSQSKNIVNPIHSSAKDCMSANQNLDIDRNLTPVEIRLLAREILGSG